MQAETPVVSGGGSQTGGLSRWGDYSSMSIDPVDDCTFWYTSQYLQSSGSFNWSTRIVLFKFAGCGTTPAPPAAPTGLSATAISAGQINLAWSDNSADEDGFRIERCAGSGCTDFAEVGSVGANTTAYQDVSGLVASTTYAYRVRAWKGALYSSYAAPVEAMTLPVTISPPNPPSQLTATASGSRQINLAWIDNSSDEDGFTIERCTGSGCTNFAALASVGANITSFQDTSGLAAATTYAYRVRAYKATVVSTYSASAEATTAPAVVAPDPPQNLVATVPQAKKQINLTWSASAGATSYDIYRSLSGTDSFVLIGSTTSTSANNGGLKSGTKYYYRVTAVKSGLESGASNVASATAR
jgi:titin